MVISSNTSFVDPAVVVSQLDILPGNTVADFGCGSGFFSFECAKKVGEEGIVYALDVLPSALEAVVSRAKTVGVHNILTKRVNLEKEHGSGLEENSVDWVILKDVLLQNTHKDIILGEMARILKPGGQALIMEWSPKELMVGPEKSMRMEPEALKALVVSASLKVEKDINVGGFHYGFIVKK